MVLRNHIDTFLTHTTAKGVEAAGRFQKGASGYSHLECCANIPYNLEEEPELLDTITNPKEKDEHEGGEREGYQYASGRISNHQNEVKV